MMEALWTSEMLVFYHNTTLTRIFTAMKASNLELSSFFLVMGIRLMRFQYKSVKYIKVGIRTNVVY